MADPYKKVRPGERLNISARAWNRAQEAADRVLGAQPGFGAGPLSASQLPSVRVTLRDRGWFGQCRFADCDASRGRGLAATVPVANETIGNATEGEKALLNLTLPFTTISSTDRLDPRPYPQSGLFVCVGNDSNEYAMSGLAITRVRVFNYLHRYARCPVAFPGQTQQQQADVQGSLDSAFWGVAKIIGYCGTNYGPAFAVTHDNTPGLSYPNFEYRWALIQF